MGAAPCVLVTIVPRPLLADGALFLFFLRGAARGVFLTTVPLPHFADGALLLFFPPLSVSSFLSQQL